MQKESKALSDTSQMYHIGEGSATNGVFLARTAKAWTRMLVKHTHKGTTLAQSMK